MGKRFIAVVIFLLSLQAGFADAAQSQVRISVFNFGAVNLGVNANLLTGDDLLAPLALLWVADSLGVLPSRPSQSRTNCFSLAILALAAAPDAGPGTRVRASTTMSAIGPSFFFMEPPLVSFRRG